MNRNLQKLFPKGLFVAVLLIALILSGCNQGNTKTLVYWTMSDPGWMNANNAIIKKFAEKYPDIKIKMETFPYDTFIQKMKAAYGAKNESDIQQIFGSWAVDYTKNGLFDAVPADLAQEAGNKYFAAPLGGYIHQGVLYGIPREFNIENGGVLYWPDLLKQAGYNQFPTTWEELIACAKKTSQYDSAGNLSLFGLDITSVDSIPYLFLALILQQGADYWQDDKIHVKFTTPEAEKALQTMADLILKDKICDLKRGTMNQDNNDFFFQKRSAMCFRGPWVISNGLTNYKAEGFGYGIMPSFTGESYDFAAESGWGEVVSSRCRNKEAAWTFIRFATSEANNFLWNQLTYTVPADKKIAQSEEFGAQMPLMKAILEMLPYGRPIGPLQNVDTFKYDIVGAQFKSLIAGDITVKTALKNIEDQTNKTIDNLLAQ